MSECELRDSFGRLHDYLRISLTDRCDLRCSYCMPEHVEWLHQPSLLTADEIERLARLFVTLGIKKIRLTGGEPLLRTDAIEIARRLSRLKSCGLHTLAITTNGTRLRVSVRDLRSVGVDDVTISLDTLRSERFHAITGRDKFQEVWQGIEAALQAGYSPLKLNVVVARGVNHDELLDVTRLACERPIVVRFIEYMPFRANRWTNDRLVSFAEMLDTIGSEYRLDPISEPAGVAKYYSVNGGIGTIGFITSMTDDFCDSCSRLRLTADGALKNCLHSNNERPLRELLRSSATDDDIIREIQLSLAAKAARHADTEVLYQLENRAMVAIGG